MPSTQEIINKAILDETMNCLAREYASDERHARYLRAVFTHRFRSHFGCRVPSEVSQTISVTFAAS